ncbi:T6SS phospholipase effector Tle1-like catalytic domain-containing protein [Pseudomonas japonica]|uniref:T6SS phospholipase effector Tle1-like catalytic domain-containing protein n=1 Tax=Pseudomonas japonica TaxID=256466 RepID=UPI00382D5CC3
MSEMNLAPVCLPPQFPVQGRLPSRVEQVKANLRIQREPEDNYRDALSLAAGRRVIPPCCKSLHISLFFDGTGNNLNHDLYTARPASPTNIGRLFRATIGDGYAGGTVHSGGADSLTDPAGTGHGQFFKYYIPGVGTPFPEVGDLEYSDSGLIFANAGEERINWGLLMIVDALRRAMGMPWLGHQTLRTAIDAMTTTSAFGIEAWQGMRNRRFELFRQLSAVEKPLRIAMDDRAGQSRLLGVRLYVYGFSRGAASARAFVHWLNLLLGDVNSSPVLRFGEVELPIQVQYLGLLDTVASVGIADAVPGADGHMSWADETQELPTSKLVKRCLHIVASHEQRLSFPLDSIRRADGSYPENSTEVVHPGVHSDQGGGYPPGDQGKGIGENDGLLLSQIALHDMYSNALANGAPLKMPKHVVPVDHPMQQSLMMSFEVLNLFRVESELINRFNAWREVTLGLSPAPQPLPIEQVENYQPIPADKTVEDVLRDQLGWITAWRIDRYAFKSLQGERFWIEASDTEAPLDIRERAEEARDLRQDAVEARRQEQRFRERFEGLPPKPLEPGVKYFDADIGKTQLSDAAHDFAEVYRRQPPVVYNKGVPVTLPDAMKGRLLLEHEHIKALGRQRVSKLFPTGWLSRNHTTETNRGEVDEDYNRAKPTGMLRALFDDHIHDSRAWFMYNWGREPLGSYLAERMVFFGATHRRALAEIEQRHAELVASGVSLPPAPTPRADVMDAERLAQVQKEIDAEWQAYYESIGEVNDASA